MNNGDEIQVNSADIKAVFNAVSEIRAHPSGMSRLFKQDKISVEDLRMAWQKEDYPDDIRDIERILTQAGFNEREIRKAFISVFGKSKDNDYNVPVASVAILKIAEYARKTGIDDELIAFMRAEYEFKESYARGGKVLVEDIKKIFTIIIDEGRVGLPYMRQLEEVRQFGRNHKTRTDEILKLQNVLKSDQYITILRRLKTDIKSGIDVTHIKNQIIQSWKRGMKARKHYDGLLNSININIGDLIDK